MKTEYTVEMKQALVAGYDPQATQEVRDEQVKGLADKFDLTVPQVRGVLVSEKVYVAKTRKADGTKELTKEEMVKFMAAMVGVDYKDIQTFEKATVKALRIYVEAYQDLLNAAHEAQKQ